VDNQGTMIWLSVAPHLASHSTSMQACLDRSYRICVVTSYYMVTCDELG
jgi:hypothetical protein